MARSVSAMHDWHIFQRRSRSRAIEVWSRFPVELGPDLIVTPHLFDWPPAARRGAEVYTCGEAPQVAVFCGRGADHLQFLEEEVIPRVCRRIPSVCLVEPEADRLRLFPRDIELPLAELGPMLRALWQDPELETPSLDPGPVPARFPWRWAPPAAEALRELEAHPIRLWEALFWRGHTWRTELVGGEVPLVGDLGTPAAAASTLAQLVEDAARLVREPARPDDGWTRCGPFRFQVREDRVEVRIRPSPADVRATFLPQTRVVGDGNLPSILGVLLAGGDNGKTELIDGWTWSTAILASPEEARDAAEALAPAVRDWTGAPVRIGGRPDREADRGVWVFEAYDRYLRVSVPLHRQRYLPWRVLEGELAAEP